MVSALTEELVRRGHDVTLFATGDSETSAKLISVYPRSLREVKVDNLYGTNYWQLLNIGLAYQMQDQFDLIHDHNAPLSLPTANLAKTPVVVTVHGSFNAGSAKLYEGLTNLNLVSISKAQTIPLPNLNYVGNVYNGLEMEDYPFSGKPGSYLLYVGRISPEKGLHFAIEVAQSIGLPLIIAAKLDQKDNEYFNDYIRPKLSNGIQWIGEVDTRERNRLMSEAFCLLHPITWREPFGLVLIEALACGCPVMAFNRGSIPEILLNGETGFIVEDATEMIEAVSKIPTIDRRFCRDYALKNFNAKKMADGYEAVYRKILGFDKRKQNFLQNASLNL